MILPDHRIKVLGQNGMIEPYDEHQVEPASYDVRLGNEFLIFERAGHTELDLDDPVDITKKVHVEDGGRFVLHPGEFALGVTREVVKMPDNLAARIEGKSSVGRFGMMVHVTAGYIDPGFHGPITLEMAAFHPYPIVLRPGKLIAQLSFELLESPCAEPYQGRYQGAKGVESSKYGQATHDEWGRPLNDDGSVDIRRIGANLARNDPRDGNTYVQVAAEGESVRATDIFGGHEVLISLSEWGEWENATETEE